MIIKKQEPITGRFLEARTHRLLLGGIMLSQGQYGVKVSSLGTESVGPKVQMRVKFAH